MCLKNFSVLAIFALVVYSGVASSDPQEVNPEIPRVVSIAPAIPDIPHFLNFERDIKNSFFSPLDDSSFQPKDTEWVLITGNRQPATIKPRIFGTYPEYISEKYSKGKGLKADLNRYDFVIKAEKINQNKKIKTYKISPVDFSNPSVGPVVTDDKGKPVLFFIFHEAKSKLNSKDNVVFALTLGPEEDSHHLLTFEIGEKQTKPIVMWAGDLNADSFPDFVIRNGEVDILYLARSKNEYEFAGHVNRGQGCGSSTQFQPPPFELLLNGASLDECQFPISRINEEYFGIYKATNGKLLAKKFHLKIDVDSFDCGDPLELYYDLKAKFYESESPLFALRGHKVSVGKNAKIEDVRVSTNDLKAEQFTLFEEKDLKLIFRKVAPKDVENSGYVNRAVVVVSAKNREIVLLNEDRTLSDEMDESHVDLEFSGDVNGDGITDFMMKSGPTYRSSVTYFFLSKKVKGKIEYQMVVYADGSGMC